MKKRFLAVIIVASLMVPFALFADTMPCGKKMVATGNSTGEVLIKCGEPLSKEYSSKKVFKESKDPKVQPVLAEEIKIEKWTYKQDDKKFIRIVTFHNGVIKKIETGSRK